MGYPAAGGAKSNRLGQGKTTARSFESDSQAEIRPVVVPRVETDACYPRGEIISPPLVEIEHDQAAARATCSAGTDRESKIARSRRAVVSDDPWRIGIAYPVSPSGGVSGLEIVNLAEGDAGREGRRRDKSAHGGKWEDREIAHDDFRFGVTG